MRRIVVLHWPFKKQTNVQDFGPATLIRVPSTRRSTPLCLSFLFSAVSSFPCSSPRGEKFIDWEAVNSGRHQGGVLSMQTHPEPETFPTKISIMRCTWSQFDQAVHQNVVGKLEVTFCDILPHVQISWSVSEKITLCCIFVPYFSKARETARPHCVFGRQSRVGCSEQKKKRWA